MDYFIPSAHAKNSRADCSQDFEFGNSVENLIFELRFHHFSDIVFKNTDFGSSDGDGIYFGNGAVGEFFSQG